MQKRTLKVAVLAVLAVVLVLAISLPVLADVTWKDLPDTVTAKYGLTDNQVAAISEGFQGGLWMPYQPVTRAQFTKMAVAAFNVKLVDPATASFTDVPKGSYYYQYIEGAKAAGLVNGTTATTFGLNVNITRQQAIAIVARYIAQVNGYNLATKYSADEIGVLLKHFGDAASVSADLKAEMAFAFDMGLTTGDNYGNLDPLANLTRIQGAAFLIRAEGLVPPAHWTPAKMELVSQDKTEGLIGQAFKATFKVTDASGHPAIGVLVDFDTLEADWYVGNISPEAALTNNDGEVTVTMLSTEPGIERISASVNGLGIQYTTRYWLALDEVYNVKGNTAQNNAGVEHTWGVRVVVFGPGPESTSVSDWYNAIYTKVPFDQTNVNQVDGIDADDYGETNWGSWELPWTDNWSIDTETLLAKYGYKPRTLAGVDVKWAIVDRKDDPTTKLTNEAETSVGNITKVDGAAITPAKTATGKTDADGLSTITIYSEKTGHTYTQAIADYVGNPYPQELFDHQTFEKADWWHNMDWDDQPTTQATETKTWIAHTFGSSDSGPITPAYTAANIGEEKTLTIKLVDTYGNPVAGRQVEWFEQGVGFFQTDDSGDTSDPNVAANNHDFDVTDANGQATLFVKSYNAGEQIIHAKVRDKGTGGAEGTFDTWTAEVQWFDADIVTFDNPATQLELVVPHPAQTDVPNGGAYIDYHNEAVSSNPVNTSHTFDLWVYGLKLEYDPTTRYLDGQTPFVDSDAAGHSYDAVIDSHDADYFGGILMYPLPLEAEDHAAWVKPGSFNTLQWFEDKMIALWSYQWRWPATGPKRIAMDWDENGVIEKISNVTDKQIGISTHGEAVPDDEWADETGTIQANVAGVWTTLSFEGAYTMYDYNDDGYKEAFTGIPGIYLPLQGKTVVFSKANSKGPGLSNLGTAATTMLDDYTAPFTFLPYSFAGATVNGVGSITSPTAAVTTDAAGKASVTITSNTKGPETIKGVVTWPGNPHNGAQLLSAYAKKIWTAGTVGSASDVTIEVYLDGVKVASNKDATLPGLADKAMWTTVWNGNAWVNQLNYAHVEVHVKDAYGNDLPDYEVVYLLENIDQSLAGAQNAVNTRIPFAYLVDKDIYNDQDAAITHGDPTKDSAGYPNYDQNGARPDSDEPSPASDPYAVIVGPGYNTVLDLLDPAYNLADHTAFFFNQWLGSDEPTYAGRPGLPKWWTTISNVPSFISMFPAYSSSAHDAWENYVWPSYWPSEDALFDGFDGFVGVWVPSVGAPPVYTGVYTGGPVGLATDGAKAWTLDGYFDASALWGTTSPDIEPNMLTGSNIDIQLAEGDYFQAPDYESILRVMVYAPADGLVKEGAYIYSTQVHQVWEPPVPTTIALSPATDYAIAGLETESYVATVKDQFGNPMPNQTVHFISTKRDGVGNYLSQATGTLLEGDVAPLFNSTVPKTAITDVNGNASVVSTLATAGQWGVESVYAFVDSAIGSVANVIDYTPGGNPKYNDVVSNAAVIQWIKVDDPAVADALVPSNQVTATARDQKVVMTGVYGGWNGMLMKVYLNPGGNTLGSLGSGTYVSGTVLDISTNAHSWVSNEPFYVNASSSSNSDNVPNWVYTLVGH